MWPVCNRRHRDIVASLTEGQLDIPTGYRQWPI